MFGMRLKSWMEAHLGRPRQKSNHQNQKSHRTPKDALNGDGSSSSAATTFTNNTTTTLTTPLSPVLSSSTPNSHSNDQYNNFKDSNLEDPNSPSSDFSLNSNSQTSPSSSSVQLQLGSSSAVKIPTAQLQKQQEQQGVSSSTGENCETKDHSGKLLHEESHHQRTTCPRSGSVSNSTSNSILLGSFSNNLSSPDTGYSTDGYSPKSVYPALSFESSGKSTPKSSYTISSLVSSELLSKHTTSLSSGSCSVQNGLELDHECISPLPTTSLPTHSKIDRSSNENYDLNSVRDSQDNSVVEKHQEQVLFNSHSINHETKTGTTTTTTTGTSSSQSTFRGNDTVTTIQCNSTNSLVSHLHEFPLHSQQSSSSIQNQSIMMVAPKQTLSNFGQHRRDNNEQNCGSENFLTNKNPFLQNYSQEDSNHCRNLHHHRRTESMEERPTTGGSDTEVSGGSSCNSSSVLTASNSRNIRTSFVLPTTTSASLSSQIHEGNNFSLKNAFSICSPRKERTRIKTNPWITLSQQNNDGNSNANTESNSVIRINSGGCAVLSNSHGQRSSSRASSESSCTEKATMHHQVCKDTCAFPKSNIENTTNSKCNGVDSTETVPHISSSKLRGGESFHGSDSGACDRGMDHLHDSSSLVYRISASTNSDSGKGSLEPGTNRHSTESSCLLSDSASTRNSIISHETELGASSESRSRSSSSSATHDTYSNDKGVVNTLFSNVEQVQKSSEDHQQCYKDQHQCEISSPLGKVKKKLSSISVVVNETATPVRVHGHLKGQNSYHDNSHLSETEATSTSVTLPPELVISGSISAQANVIMVDKETDIISDWANTDDDGEDEIETDRNDEDEDRVTPTPSTPDTDTGGRAIFQTSQSTSSATDIDFGDSSAATAASSQGIIPSSSVFRDHYTQNVNRHPSNSRSKTAVQYHHHNFMNPTPTTCYQPIQIMPAVVSDGHFHVQDKKEMWAMSEDLINPHQHQLHMPTDVLLNLGKSGVMCPPGHVLGIPNANISLSSLYSNASEPSDYNANKPPSSIARGALGFLRKIFKKGSCSSHRTSPGSDKVKISRSSKSKDSHLNNIPTITGLRSPLLTADALISPHPLGRKSSINGYFLTPTPNAFRRRSGTGTDSSDSKSSKHHKSVKTDIIRLPVGALSPNQQGQNYMQQSSSSTSSSKNTSLGAFCISSLQNNTYASGNGNNIRGYSNTNTNSTSASSVHSMSTSTSAASGAGLLENNVNSQTPRQNQSRLNDNLYSNSTSHRQSPFMSNQQNVDYTISPNPIGKHSSEKLPPQLPALPPVPMSMHCHNQMPFDITSQTQIIQHQQQGYLHPTPRNLSHTSCGVCPHESPRISNPQACRINSPSFNNYSPIHRLVVMGGNHINNRGQTIPSSSQLMNSQSASTSSHGTFLESPHISSRKETAPQLATSKDHSHNHNHDLPNSQVSHSHNNNSTFTPVPNRSLHHHPTSPSPLINHNQSISSPRSNFSSGQNQTTCHTFTSPSPILRNPRYQYITSSNQNSPVLNVPKRINVPVQNQIPPHNHQQQQYYYPQNQVPFPQSSNPNPNGFPPFSTFSPKTPSRQNNCHASNNNPFSSASPNLNHHNLQNQNPSTPLHVRQQRSSSLDCEFEIVNSPNPIRSSGNGGGNILNSSSDNRNNLLSRSQSYQTHQVHYYASPVVPPPQVPAISVSQAQQQRQSHSPHIHSQAVHPSSLHFFEPPLLMRTHLHNQNIRLNNFLMNKQRHQQHNSNTFAKGNTTRLLQNSESLQERIYETVDSEDDEDDGDEGENSNAEAFSIHHQLRNSSYYPSQQGYVDNDRRNRLPTATSQESGFQQQNCNNDDASIAMRAQQNLTKSKRSKPKLQSENRGVIRPRPPVPMALFGPNTFLSETETRLLEADKEADRKYKRLINEAEALLREISAVKSQTPWAQDHRDQERLRVEDCPQSDPLRRKAYDCWALRRLQQELAGCCASPPVLHRSRMNLQSPSTPTAANISFLPQNLSLVNEIHSRSQLQHNTNTNVMDSNQNAHF